MDFGMHFRQELPQSAFHQNNIDNLRRVFSSFSLKYFENEGVDVSFFGEMFLRHNLSSAAAGRLSMMLCQVKS